ncbi:MAG: PTS sugar transporter subunit IIA [Thiothrix sp.]|nr:PTS sugar transporter subunit IIA [Thiothrix sp.]
MDISKILNPDHILLSQSPGSRAVLLNLLARSAAEALGLSEADIRQALEAREALGTTGIGGGVAIPHATLDGLDAPFLMPVILRKPVEMDAVDEAPVDLVFLSLFPTGDQISPLKLMSAITRRLNEEGVAETLRKAKDAETAFFALTQPSER